MNTFQLTLYGSPADDEYQDALTRLRAEREQVKRARIVLEECERREHEAFLKVLELEQPDQGKGN